MSAAIPIILGVVIAVVLGIARDTVMSVLAGEVKGALQDRLARRVHKAAAHLPDGVADEFETEWLAELRTLSDRPITALRFTRGLARAGRQIAREVESMSPESGSEQRQRRMVVNFEGGKSIVVTLGDGDLPVSDRQLAIDLNHIVKAGASAVLGDKADYALMRKAGLRVTSVFEERNHERGAEGQVGA